MQLYLCAQFVFSLWTQAEMYHFGCSVQEEMFAVLCASQEFLAGERRAFCAKHLVKLHTMRGLWILFIRQRLR